MSCLSCLHHKQNIDKDGAWRAQNEENRTNPVYKLVNITQTGELMQLYTDAGPRGVEKYCREKLSAYLYNNGNDSQVIKIEEYTKWRQHMDTKQTWMERFECVYQETSSRAVDAEDVIFSLQKYDFVNDEVIRFSDHKACWDLECRGAVGETVLHLCYLNNTPIHLEIAKVLLDLYPKLALDIYEAEEYYGESCLHFAVVHEDLEAVKLLVEKGANVNQRATGRFFLPEDQKTEPKARNTNYKGDVYYGEYPLAFAACLGLESIYDYLINNGANPNLQDTYGNTVLHMTVIKNKPAMYSYAARHPVRRADHWKKNYRKAEHTLSDEDNGLTPLALACKLGRQQVMEEIMELHVVELWRFSNVNCSIYPIQAVDTIAPDGNINWNSSLMITLNGKDEAHTEMLQSGVLRQLLDEKWKTFVRRRFFYRLAILLFHLLVLNTSVWLRPKTDVQLLKQNLDGLRLFTEILTMISCVVVLIFYVQEVRFLGAYFAVSNLKNSPFKAIYLLGCLFQLVLVPLRLASLNYHQDKDTLSVLQKGEETVLILTLPMTWGMILFYAKVTMRVGPLVNIVLVYIRRDLLPFLMILIVAFVAFAVAFFHMWKTIDDDGIQSFSTPIGSAMRLFIFTLGEFEYDEFLMTRTPAITMIVFIIFMTLMPILLLNMLIAMMASTFQTVIKKSEKDWIHQWAKITILLERTFSAEELLEYQKLYSVTIDNPAQIERGCFDGDVDYRGVMVIRTTTKTKAKQRRDALRYWKRAQREIMSRIREVKEDYMYRGRVPTINFKTLFPEADDIFMVSSPARHRRRGSNISDQQYGQTDMAAAVSQLAEASIPTNLLREPGYERAKPSSPPVYV